MGAAILVTLGVLLLVQEYWYFYFGRTWPVLLIVIGLLLISAHNASTEGHIQPWWARGRSLDEESKQKNPYQNGREPQVKL